MEVINNLLAAGAYLPEIASYLAMTGLYYDLYFLPSLRGTKQSQAAVMRSGGCRAPLLQAALPSTLWATLRVFKIVPDDFVAMTWISLSKCHSGQSENYMRQIY